MEWAKRLFPEPLAPTTARTSPEYSSILKSFIACTWERFRPLVYWVKPMAKFSTVNMGGEFEFLPIDISIFDVLIFLLIC